MRSRHWLRGGFDRLSLSGWSEWIKNLGPLRLSLSKPPRCQSLLRIVSFLGQPLVQPLASSLRISAAGTAIDQRCLAR